MWWSWWRIFFFLFALEASSDEDQPCRGLSLLPSNESIGEILSRYSSICYAQIPINYQLCLRLLERSEECNALVYSNARCTLYDRSKKATSRTLNKTSGHRFPAIHYQATSAPRQCLPADRKDNDMASCLSTPSQLGPSLGEWLDLPSLGIVMAVTADWVQANWYELDRITDNWRCYAKIHNYSFVSSFALSVPPDLTNLSEASACDEEHGTQSLLSPPPPFHRLRIPSQVSLLAHP
jgi:hypothetical protein